MLDQNTDRMWYIIGAIVIGAAIIAMGLNIFSESFDSVGELMNSQMFIADGLINDMSVKSPVELFKFNEIDGGYEVDGFDMDYVDANLNGKTPRSISIPAEYNGKPVIKVADRVWPHNTFDNISELILPNTMQTIGNYSFRNNKISVLNLPESVSSIGMGAFELNHLSNLKIPKTVNHIGSWAFNRNRLPDRQAFIYARNSDGSENKDTLISYGGSRMSNIVIPDNVRVIGSNAFMNVGIESVSLPKGVTRIGGDAFRGNKLKVIDLPEGLMRIDYSAFFHNLLTSVTIPESVNHIGEGSFTANRLTGDDVFIYARNQDGSVNNSELVSYAGSNRDVIIPDNVRRIVGWSFRNMHLNSVYIPDSVNRIDGYAFYYSHSVKVSLSSDLSFSNNAFEDGAVFEYR